MCKKILILLNCLFAVILLFELYEIFVAVSKKGESKKFYQQKTVLGKPRSIQNENLNPLTASSIYSGLQWGEVTENDPDSLLNDHPFLYDSQGNGINLHLSGKEWVAKEKNISKGDKVYEFSKSSDNLLEKLNWSRTIQLSNGKINVISGDRPGASIWGYAKITGKQVQIVLLNFVVDYNGASTNESFFNCPCNNEYRIFVSDPISIETLIKSTKEN